MGVYIWTGTPQTRTEYANYTFDDQSNSQITDTSGNGKNLTGGTMPTYSLVSGTNYAGVFTNANTSALAPSVSVANLGSDFAELVWVKATASSQSYISCVKGINNQEGIGHQISLICNYNSGQFEYFDEKDVNDVPIIKRYTIKSSASLNTWYLIGFVRSNNGETVKTYFNGALVGTNTSNTSGIDKTLNLGSSEVGDRFRGQIGECFIAEGVFTDADVLDYYNQTKGDYETPTPLVAWYKFDGNLTDSSGNQCDLSVISNRSGTGVAPTYTTLSSGEEVADVTRGGLRTTIYNPVWDPTSWASSCWVKRTANHLSVVWYWGDSNSDGTAGNGIGTGMIIQQSGQLVIFKWNSDVATGVTISSNTRHHIVYSHENGTTSVYVDGVLGATKSVTYTRNTDTLRVFSQFNVGADYYEGEFDDFRLYGGPLSSSEVVSLYNSNKSKYGIS